MKKESCDVIRDLLPLYEDGVASEKAQTMVREHLKDCPACREELRKMRTPLSLPPEQDEELWRKYSERRAEIQRKRRKKLAIAAAVLAVVVLACLWYTRPRSWDGLTNAGSEEVTSLSANLLVYYFHSDEEGNIDHGWDVWLTQADQSEGPATQAIVEAFQSCTYRKSLKNLIPRDSWVTTNVSKVQVGVGIVWNNTRFMSFNVNGDGQIFIDGDLYYTDKGLADRLAPIVQEYGTFQE